MTDREAAIKYAKLHGFNKVVEDHKPEKYDPRYDPKYEGCSFFTASEHSDDEFMMDIYIVKNGIVRPVESQEEANHIIEITFPPCV